MKRIGWVLFMVVAVAFWGYALGGPDLISIIYRPTVYTLPAGTWQIKGTFNPFAFGTPSVGVAYGLTESVQASASLTGLARGAPNLGVKSTLGQVGPMALAASGGITFILAGASLYLSGLVASLQAEVLGVHVGSSLQLLPEVSLSPYAAFDYAVTRNVALLGEVSVLPFQARVGALLRPLRSFDLKVWTGFPVFSVGASCALHF